MTLILLVLNLMQYQSVTDGRTDTRQTERQTDGHRCFGYRYTSSACI